MLPASLIVAVELWHFRYSHYNEKARWALDYKRIPHRRHALVPGFHVPAVRRMTGQAKTPVVRIDGELVWDSRRIIAALEQRYPERPLYPADAAARTRALAEAAWFDEEVGADIRRLLYAAYLEQGAAATARMSTDGHSRAAYYGFCVAWPLLAPVIRHNMGIDGERVARAEQRLPRFFERIERGLTPSGHLAGDGFSVADLTAAALLSPLVMPQELGEARLPDPPPRWLAWRAQVAGREGFSWVETMYARHRRALGEDG